MKKKSMILLLVLVCVLLFAGCACEHQWKEADCVMPKTCTECEETEGMPLGHVWMAATCTEPKTCETCGVTEGEAKGHVMVEATCEEAKHCENCNLVEGEALGHDWINATTEAPKTCAACSATEGERIITDSRFTTAAAKELLGVWGCPLDLDASALGIAGFEGIIPFTYYLEFGPAGDMYIYMGMEDEEGFLDALINATIEATYLEMEAQGFTREAADEAMVTEYGMTVEEYVVLTYDSIDFSALMSMAFGMAEISGVYYVEDGFVYSAETWEDEMEPSAYAIDGEWLTVDAISEALGIDMEFFLIEKY